MNFLKRKVIKSIPAWMIVLLMIGTVTGAFLWISNLISTDVTVTNPPVEITGSFESVHYVSMEMTSTFPYTLHNPVLAVGYLVIEITQPGMSLAQIGGLNVRVINDMGGDMTGYALSTDPISDGYRFVFCDTDTMDAFDFGEGGMATAGEIYVGITFESTGTYSVSMQISQTAT